MTKITLEQREIFKVNFRHYVTNTDMTTKKFAEDLDYSYTSVRNWWNGDRIPQKKALEDLADYFNITVDDFFSDNTFDEKDPLASELAMNFSKLNVENKKKIIQKTLDLLANQENSKDVLSERIVAYPFEYRTKVAAGLGYGYDDLDSDIAYINFDPDELGRYDFATMVSGDSMEPEYHDGDIVLLRDLGFKNFSGEVVVIVINDKSFLKKVYLEKNQLRLVSINKKYDDILFDFPPDEDTHIKIFSVVDSFATLKTRY
ncbi:XRE family transcriptional regulator [Pseudolactococcus insecticola]|uniref:Transcriptional regulator n=1 Tax=Pseudolactococcus insecticola TaxID=2709158 RepID=A0A6A0B9X5_9LACT|nr:XRE family transcriptional regulator [Lactococcus insecticola]GFH41248.1 transcriptional regulator [Lactococcus insecticola]